MTRNLRRLGLTLVAVFALGAVGSSAASASEFTVEGTPVFVIGEQVNIHVNRFTFGAINVECEKGRFEQTLVEAAVTEIPFKAKYEECKEGEHAASINMNGCEYVFTAKTDANEHSQLHIACPAGKKIEISIPALSCTLKLSTQTPEKGVHYTNTGKGKTADYDATITAEKITYEKVGGAQCQLIAGNEKEGKYISELTVRAYNDEEGTPGTEQRGTSWVK